MKLKTILSKFKIACLTTKTSKVLPLKCAFSTLFRYEAKHRFYTKFHCSVHFGNFRIPLKFNYPVAEHQIKLHSFQFHRSGRTEESELCLLICSHVLVWFWRDFLVFLSVFFFTLKVFCECVFYFYNCCFNLTFVLYFIVTSSDINCQS